MILKFRPANPDYGITTTKLQSIETQLKTKESFSLSYEGDGWFSIRTGIEDHEALTEIEYFLRSLFLMNPLVFEAII